MMRRISLTLLATTAIGVVACQGASAADILRKAPPPAPLAAPVHDWSGIYVGAEGGYGWGHQSFNSTVPFLLHPGNTVCINGGANGNECGDFAEFNDFANDAALLDDPNIGISGHNQSGGVVGGFFGAQKQWGSWVLGLEGSIDYAHITGSQNGSSVTNTLSVIEADTSLGRFTEKTNNVGQFSSTIDTLGAVNAKIGWVPAPQWLLYATGGLAFAHERNNFSFSQSLFHLDCDTTDALECDARTGFFDFARDGGSFDGFIRFANNSFGGSAGTTMFGWTAGAGIDFMVPIDAGSAWVFGVDYKHYGFGRHTFSFAGAEGATFSVNTSQDVDVVRGRISYLFSIH